MCGPNLLQPTKPFHHWICLVPLWPTLINLLLQVHLGIQTLGPSIMSQMIRGICNRWHHLKVLIKSSLAMVKVFNSTQLVLAPFHPQLTLTHLSLWIIFYIFHLLLRIKSVLVSFIVTMESTFYLPLTSVLSNLRFPMRCYLMVSLELMGYMSFPLSTCQALVPRLLLVLIVLIQRFLVLIIPLLELILQLCGISG